MNFFKSKNRIDIDEKVLKDTGLLSILLLDRSSGKNIIWATDTYLNAPEGKDRYRPTMEITEDKIFRLSKEHSIKPRCIRVKEEQKKRTKDKAEVFTPSWVCNKQANSIDRERFGKDVFNIEKDRGWETIKDKIPFTDNYKWIDYVKENVIEITCGEAPYLVSRYDTVTGEWIDIKNRIGLLDRKIRVINENAKDDKEWLDEVKIAYQHTYGYEWQGDSLLLARENLLATFINYYEDRFKKEIDDINLLKEICEIISWNIWQMDGLKCVIPLSCEEEIKKSNIMEHLKKCFGCLMEPIEGLKATMEDIKNPIKPHKSKDVFGKETESDKNHKRGHWGIVCQIKDWEKNEAIPFISCIDFTETEKPKEVIKPKKVTNNKIKDLLGVINGK